jgi:putative inorganic carbon (HCO3(-)) transporter
MIRAGESIALLSAGFALLSVLLMERSPIDTVSSVQDYIGESIQNNVAAGALVVLLPISLALFLGVWRHGHLSQKLTFGFCVFAGVLGLSVAQSRGAIVALGVALAVLAFGFVRAPRWLLPSVACVLILASLGGILASPLYGLVGSSSAADLAVRTEIWSRAGQAIGDYPLTGVGLGAFREVVPALYPYIISDPSRVNHAHNLYLQIGSDLGVLGLIGFVALVLVLLARASAHLSRAGSDDETHLRWLRVGCCAGLLGMLVHGSVEAVTWGVRPAFLAWTVLGLLLALGAGRSEATDSA